jgi:phosphatidylglycerol:prolipoprotein diacylglycerol transferase
MTVDALGIHLGPLYIRFYGLILVGGLLLAASLAAWMAARDKRDPDHVWGALTWALIPGIIGARLWFVFFPSSEMVERGFTFGWFLSHPFDMVNGPLAIWNGGLGIFGAVLGGILGIVLYTRRYRLRFWEWIDIGAVALPLAQAIGRWGNLVNQELYGHPTTLPWGITIDRAARVGQYQNMLTYPVDTRFHPIFLYESLWNALTAVLLLYLWLNFRRRFRHGDFLLLYLVSYAIIRFSLEFLRVDVTLVSAINVSQVTSLVVGFAALGVFLWRRWRAPAMQTYEANPGEESFASNDF